MSARIAKSSTLNDKNSAEPRKYQKQLGKGAARLAAYRAKQSALEDERLLKQEKKRKLDEEEATRREERDVKTRRLAEKNRQLQQEEDERSERERRRRIGLPETSIAESMEQRHDDPVLNIAEEPDVEEVELSTRLRALNELVRLFGETHEEQLKRLYKVQRARSRKKVTRRAEQPVMTSLEPLNSTELEIDKKIPPHSNYQWRPMLARQISSWLNTVLFE